MIERKGDIPDLPFLTVTYGTYHWTAVPADRSHGPGLAAECSTLMHLLYAGQRARDAAEADDVCRPARLTDPGVTP